MNELEEVNGAEIKPTNNGLKLWERLSAPARAPALSSISGTASGSNRGTKLGSGERQPGGGGGAGVGWKQALEIVLCQEQNQLTKKNKRF